MSSLSFVPRKLAKNSNAKPQTSTPKATSYQPPGSPATTPAIHKPPTAIHDLPSKYDDKDCANLVALSLSDYALWIDADLRQKLGPSAALNSAGDANYIPFAYLLDRSLAIASLIDERPGKESHTTRSKVQTALVKGIRTHASHLFDIRLLLHADQNVPRFGKQKDIGGGYEVRRKRVGLIVRGKLEWDACTLYVENIPPGYRSYAGIIRFLNGLLHAAPSIPSTSILPADPLTRVQWISFPPHYNDKPDTRPSCKGFALVTFVYATDCEYLKESWPWLPTPSSEPQSTPPEEGDEQEPSSNPEPVHIARQYNFRVVSKERWLQFKAEYLTYRQKLVGDINAYQDARRARVQPRELMEPSMIHATNANPRDLHSERPPTEEPPTATITPSSSFPPGCLVFVKHVHPETTKTTLRCLFSQAFHTGEKQTPVKNVEGLDYVDFNKGMDTCYIRLATSTHTTALMEYFSHSKRRVVQTSGMDEVGADASPKPTAHRDLEPIAIMRVTGRPEEIYWEKVPLKVRRGAVGKAIELMALGGPGDHSREKRTQDTGDSQGNSDSARQKKRRKF
ncbi:hypothetical protein P691DRAFT_737329 [Macrolepiota fuliginosa MF-IS2]|uniref:XRRM domain-containing protein n=1 Tax=Macrolepiota fuliginosa MF-IS2 TaxID=1400762 RepID=A0A9P6BXA9_9AGAR|nr:hypothetical protein P691DRAFT_737329 [Macrolepiota fuliginosa MF-IS2]